MPTPVADLHCDLLLYLERGYDRTPHDLAARCSVPQLQAGHVVLQVLPIFVETEKGSTQRGLAQAEVFKVLANQHPDDFEHIQSVERLDSSIGNHRIGIVAAVENASSFAEEEEEFQVALDRLIHFIGKVGRPIYISLTWNTENRFGGGALTTVGLKEDGRRLLDFLHNKRIAVDLSHASDALAYDILDYLQQQNLRVPVLASHSNMRCVWNAPRNLPDELAKEIVARNGRVGFNLVRSFVGDENIPTEQALIAQLEAALAIVGENHLALGADFFYEKDLPKDSQRREDGGYFYREFEASDCYPRLLSLWQNSLGLSDETVRRLAYQNIHSFLQFLWEENYASSSAALVQL